MSNVQKAARITTFALAALAWAGAGAAHGAPSPDFKVLAAFDGVHGSGLYDQGQPTVGPDGLIYGCNAATTNDDKSPGSGRIYRVERDGTITTLHAFAQDQSEGYSAGSTLTRATNGWLYGIASLGGTEDWGTLFRVAPDGRFKVLHNFGATDGTGQPEGILTEGPDGSFYGTTMEGPYDHGTVYRLDPSGHVHILHRFASGPTDGAIPTGGVVFGRDGKLYGTTVAGGPVDRGTLFSMTTDGQVTLEHAFTCKLDGCEPGPLMLGKDGQFYGTTIEGGAEDASSAAGTVFSFGAAGVRPVYAFPLTGRVGVWPRGPLAEGPAGTLYGATQVGPQNQTELSGAVFALTPGGALTEVHVFTHGADGSYPRASPIIAHGRLVGTTAGGGLANAGTIYSIGRQP